MKNPELFHKTVGILVKAYQNDTLRHGDCSACAVGNLVRANMENPGGMSPMADAGWPTVFCTFQNEQIIKPDNLSKENAREQIKSTGYNYKNLAKIEFAFETASTKGDFMFNGLMAVIDTLMKIHEATTEEATAAKELFVKIPC